MMMMIIIINKNVFSKGFYFCTAAEAVTRGSIFIDLAQSNPLQGELMDL